MSPELLPKPLLWVAGGALVAVMVAGVAYVVYDVWKRAVRAPEQGSEQQGHSRDTERPPGRAEVCHHCGRAIHPPQPPALHDEAAYWAWATQASTQPVDCVWVERWRLRHARLGHPLSAYICLACERELDAWLRAAGQTPTAGQKEP